MLDWKVHPRREESRTVSERTGRLTRSRVCRSRSVPILASISSVAPSYRCSAKGKRKSHTARDSSSYGVMAVIEGSQPGAMPALPARGDVLALLVWPCPFGALVEGLRVWAWAWGRARGGGGISDRMVMPLQSPRVA